MTSAQPNKYAAAQRTCRMALIAVYLITNVSFLLGWGPITVLLTDLVCSAIIIVITVIIVEYWRYRGRKS